MNKPTAVDPALLPPALRDYIDAEHGHLFPAEIVDYIPRALYDASATAIFDHLLVDTPFARLRMEWRFGPITAVQCRAHPAYCYYAFVPLQLLLRRSRSAPLIVSVHGSSRNGRDFRDFFSRLAQANDAVVLAPLFPMDLTNSTPDQHYTVLSAEGARADQVLLAMVDELGAMLKMQFDRWLMFGFSGGAQFAHRFAYVHPERLRAVSIGAPGFVTLPARDKPWWTGVADLAQRFGRAYDPAALRQVAAQMLIGSQDDEAVHVWTLEELGLSATEYERYGHSRMQRLATLADAWREEGVAVDHTVVDGVGHVAFGPIAEAAARFFQSQLDTSARPAPGERPAPNAS